MGELFCRSSRLLTCATLSLERLAQCGGYGSRPVDGWDPAFCNGRDVRLYKEPGPAADSPSIGFSEERRLPTRSSSRTLSMRD